MYRVLKPGGYAVVMVPVVEGWDKTYEDSSIASEVDRLLHFGQEDHIRFYGRDVRDRFRKFFELEEYTALEPDVSRFSLQRGKKVFVCKKEFQYKST